MAAIGYEVLSLSEKILFLIFLERCDLSEIIETFRVAQSIFVFDLLTVYGLAYRQFHLFHI